jgi:hypothetical protein
VALPACDRCDRAHPDFSSPLYLEGVTGEERRSLYDLPWRGWTKDRGPVWRCVAAYVREHPGSTAVEAIRAADGSLNPYGRSYSEPVWAAIAEGLICDANEGKPYGRYRLMPVDLELAALIKQAEASQDYKQREALVDEVGGLVREQIARFVSAT